MERVSKSLNIFSSSFYCFKKTSRVSMPFVVFLSLRSGNFRHPLGEVNWVKYLPAQIYLARSLVEKFELHHVILRSNKKYLRRDQWRNLRLDLEWLGTERGLVVSFTALLYAYKAFLSPESRWNSTYIKVTALIFRSTPDAAAIVGDKNLLSYKTLKNSLEVPTIED